ncbi:DUF2848 family protein [Roseibium salinum]|nr:DUF2848 family protein [Roseibium salinum]
MLCGTLPAIGGVRPASQFKMALTDPPVRPFDRLDIFKLVA